MNKEKQHKTTHPDIDKISQETNQKVLDKYSEESQMRSFHTKKTIAWIIFIISIAYSFYHLWIQFNPLPTLKQRSIHVAIGLALIFLMFPTFKRQNREKVPFFDWIFFGLSFFTAIYILFEYNEIVN